MEKSVRKEDKRAKFVRRRATSPDDEEGKDEESAAPGEDGTATSDQDMFASATRRVRQTRWRHG
jgi:hypothetical protein